MRTRLTALAAAAVAAGIWSLLPPGPLPVPAGAGLPDPPRGAIHVHTRLSDGSGTVDQIAAAAARAGLRFVVFTDHGDGRRRPDAPTYRYGVLCIDAVEVTTTGGHVIALGLPGRTPYRLGGDARDVVEDVARLGGMSIAAHPLSEKTALQWTDWEVPFDGLEWLNADSEWRDEPRRTLAAALLTYPFRKAETVAALLDRPGDLLRRWDALTKQRTVVAVAAADAHASVGLGRFANPYGDRSPLAIPGYEHVFRAFSLALPELVLTGEAAADARAVIQEIRSGRSYTAIDALAAPGRLDFSAASGTLRVGPGGMLPASPPVSFEVRVAGPEEMAIQLLHRGTIVATSSTGTLRLDASTPGAYRVEVHLPRAPGNPPVPWMVSNPIYIGPFEAAPPARGSVPRERALQFAGGPGGPAWAIERSPQSEGRVDSVASLEGHELLWRYALGGGERDGAHVALVMPDAPALGTYDRLLFRGRASAPMRLWVQIRGHGPDGITSWRRSVYLDEQVREVSIRLADMEPVNGQPRIGPPPPAHDIMFLVDGTHTPLGTSGRVWLDDIAYAR